MILHSRTKDPPNEQFDSRKNRERQGVPKVDFLAILSKLNGLMVSLSAGTYRITKK